MRTLLVVLVIVAALGLGEGVYYFFRYMVERRREELHRRLQSLGQQLPQSTVSLLRPGRLSEFASIDAILRAFSPTVQLENLIEQADLPMNVARLLGFCLLSAFGGFALGVLAGLGAGVTALLSVVFSTVPILMVLNARDSRSRKLSRQLPEALDMMARALRAGHAIAGSFRLVASEMPSPINIEFGRAFEEQNLGLPFDRAIENIVRRVPVNRDLKIFAVSVIVQKETGGNLAEILERIAMTIRERDRFYGRLRALTAEGRVSGYILGALPILTGLFVYALNPTYIATLFTDPTGQKMLIYAISSWCLGFLWMRRMATVEY